MEPRVMPKRPPPEPDATTHEDRRSSEPAHEKRVKEIYREHRPSLDRSLRRLLPSWADRWDAIHDVFVRMLTRDRSGSMDEPKYFFGAARNAALDRIKIHKGRARIEQGLPESHEEPSAPSPESVCESTELGLLAMRCLQALPERQRTAVTLVMIDDLSYVAAAAHMGLAVHQVRRLVAKGMLDLQTAVGAARGDAHE